jgi:hypothetical protein
MACGYSMSRQLWYENIKQELIAHEDAVREFNHLQNVIASQEPTFSDEAHTRVMTLVQALRRVASEKCADLRKQLHAMERKEEAMTPTETEPVVPVEVPEEDVPEEDVPEETPDEGDED